MSHTNVVWVVVGATVFGKHPSCDANAVIMSSGVIVRCRVRTHNVTIGMGYHRTPLLCVSVVAFVCGDGTTHPCSVALWTLASLHTLRSDRIPKHVRHMWNERFRRLRYPPAHSRHLP